MKKAVIYIITLLMLAVVAGFTGFKIYQHTPHGKLDASAAFVRLLTNTLRTPVTEDPRPLDEIRAELTRKAEIIKASPEPVGRVYEKRFTHEKSGEPIRVKIYEPEGDGPWPVVIFYHGGGWVWMNPETHDNNARSICKRTHALVVSVDYRLAPENPFPAGVNDAYGALLWVHENASALKGDPKRIAVAGDSAGGNLSAVVAQLTRNRRGPKLSAQVLIYPGTDMTRLDRPSHAKFGDGFLLDLNLLEWFKTRYEPDRSRWARPELSPILARDLSGLAPALVITAGFDPLRDEGAAYAERLKSAGVETVYKNFEGQLHGFITYDRFIGKSDDALDLIAGFLREHFQGE